ncbi:B12-binding domain-containing radical SAM protein [Alloiococcus sp. CFN-8]|uniref:B12-binding domain-containing radical SAM protein n=1 Tax=Alloiococcus sp. CFN-8 TaxID=3416081 RepID=UPI003CF9AA29
MLKVALVGVNSQYIHSNLAIRYLKSYTKDLDYHCELMEFTINDRIENILEAIIETSPDVIGFSCYIWNMEYIGRLTGLIKLVIPEVTIILGGPEVSYDGVEIIKCYDVDYLVEGEGEETYRELINALIEGNKIQGIKGLFYKEGSLVHYEGARRLINMNALTFPYDTLEDLENKIIYYEASRGCPFNCSYCLSSTTHGVRFLEGDRVKAELQYFMDKGVKLVKFVDRTFNARKSFSLDIWKFLISLETRTSFHFEISADILSEEEIILLKTAPKGRFQFEIGVQTTNEEVLKKINRGAKYSLIAEKVMKLREGDNLKLHLDLIAGLPKEDMVSFKKSFNDVYALRPEAFQLGFLKLLKGSSMREEAEENKMIYSPYAPYEILVSKYISYQELRELKRIEELVDKYYNSGKFSNVIDYMTGQYNTPFDFYKKLAEYFIIKGYFRISIGKNEYYKVLINFFNDYCPKESFEAFMELLRYDYLYFNKKRGMPDFIVKKISKEEELVLREKYSLKVKEEYIEKFNIDMDRFLNNGEIIEKTSYVVFNISNPEVTAIINNL